MTLLYNDDMQYQEPATNNNNNTPEYADARRTILRDASVLAGPDLEYLPHADVVIADGVFESVMVDGKNVECAIPDRINDGDIKITDTYHPGPLDTILDCRGLLVIPGLVNCHTHIGDSIGKDARLGGSVDEKIHPVFGLKPRILSQTPADMLASFMKNACMQMLYSGTTTFVDFREGGVEGVRLLRRVLAKVPIRGIILGRTDNYYDEEQIRSNALPPAGRAAEVQSLVQECDGIGISGANENSNASLEGYAKCYTLRAIHASETRESVERSVYMTKRSETMRALQMRPHILVHMTFASKADLDAVYSSPDVRGIVACPRANGALAEGMPDVITMMGRGMRRRCAMALGTDNVMVNAPDMLREMEYTWKTAMAMHRREVDPALILKMATVNAGVMLGKKIGQISRGMLADCIFVEKHALEMEPMHSPHAAIVHRATASSIRAVMINGGVVHGNVERRG